MRIKRGDTVLIIAGKDKGKRGKVLQVFPMREKIMVEGINIRKKHVRPKRSGEKGQTVEMSLPFAISNAQVICTKCKKASRMGFKDLDDGKKHRICKKCGQPQ